MSFNLTNLLGGGAAMNNGTEDLNVTDVVNGVVVNEEDKDLFEEVIDHQNQAVVKNATEAVNTVVTKMNSTGFAGMDMNRFKQMIKNAVNESRAHWNLSSDYLSGLDNDDVVFEVSFVGKKRQGITVKSFKLQVNGFQVTKFGLAVVGLLTLGTITIGLMICLYRAKQETRRAETSIRALVGQIDPPPNPAQHRLASGANLGSHAGETAAMRNQASSQQGLGAVPKVRFATNGSDGPPGDSLRTNADGHEFEDVPLPPPPCPSPIDGASGVAFRDGKISFIDPGKLVSLYEPRLPLSRPARQFDEDAKARFHSESRRLFDEALVKARQAGIGARAIIDACPKYVRMEELGDGAQVSANFCRQLI